MAKWIGIDGGGSKTAFLAVGEDGAVLASGLGPGTDYHEIGPERVCEVLSKGIWELLRASKDEVRGVCFAMPAFGEGGAEDLRTAERIRSALSPCPVRIVNDAEAGWAGSLALTPGANIVAGTGSIAFGRDSLGHQARCGGWTEFFSDEGSGYWLGRKALELFSKQSDGRMPRGQLYVSMREALSLHDDMELNLLVRKEYAPSRERTASLQRVLEDAAQAGDSSALALYSEAGRELALIANGVLKQLSFEGQPVLSYSGGVFKTGELILEPFRRALPENVCLVHPRLSPVQGAVLLAVEQFAPNNLDSIREAMLQAR